MEWIKVIFYLCLTTCVISIKADNSVKESSPKEEKNSLSNNQQLQLNNTEKDDETLEESPSEIIRFRKPIILQEREENFSDKNYRERIRVHENHERAKSTKDLIDEENIYKPVLTFTEAPNSHLERYWKIVSEAPPYRTQNQLRNTEPITESQSFVDKPKMSSLQINHSPSGNLEGRNPDYPRSREYPENYGSHPAHYDSHPESYDSHPESYDSHPKNYDSHPKNYDSHPKNYDSHPDSENHPGRGHSVHTETTHDYGRFLPVEYKSKIEKEAESHIKRLKGQNSTKNSQQNDQENRQTAQSPYRGNDRGGNKAFFHLGNLHTPYTYKYPDVSHHQNQGYHYKSEGYPRTEKYPTQSYTYPSKKPSPPNVARDYYTPRQPISSTETYQPQLSYPAKGYLSHPAPPNAPRHYDGSTERYPPTHSSTYQKEPVTYPGTTPHSPKQYSIPAEQLPLHSPKQYSTSAEQLPPQYHSGEKSFPTSYTEDFQQPGGYTESPTKEFHEPYSNNPREPSLPPPDTPQFTKYSAPETNQDHIKTEHEISQERAYYNTYKSLMDLYKSFGFQPLNFDEMPELLTPNFAYGRTFRAKIPISGPVSGSVSTEDYASNPKVPTYADHANASPPADKNYDDYKPPYTETRYQGNKENYERNTYFAPDFTQTSMPLRSTDPHYHEQIPYDSNRSPIVSTEHYDNSEISIPGVFNTQVESPKEPYLQVEHQTKFHPTSKSTEYASPEGIKVKGIRINDYNSETFFNDQSQKNVDNSAQEYSSISSPDSPPYSHSIVRKNPYHLNSPYSEEVRATNRPRIYNENHNLESLPFQANSEEGINNFDNNEKANKFHPLNVVDTNTDSSVSDDNRPNEYNLSKPKKTPSEYKNHQWNPNSADRHLTEDMKSEISHDGHRKRNNKRKIPLQNSENKPFQDESSYEQHDQRSGRNTNGDVRPKTKGKRTSQKRPKKHKPRSRSHGDDHLRAEGSTYHWGMEKHKGTDGFFQYANVPGAKAFEFGYRMGGPEKTEERYHRTKGIQSKIKVNWEDGNGDTGDHYWEFNHDSREDDTEEQKPKEKKSQSDE